MNEWMKHQNTIFLFYTLSSKVTHKGWDCKDDLKLFKYENPKSKVFCLKK